MTEEKQIRALVADDIAVNLTLVATILKKEGCFVDTVENGKEAFDKVKMSDYDIIFMDCHMPQMDGYKATESIRSYEEDEGKQNIPIIAVTADVMDGNRERCLASGMSDYLSKPIKKDQIIDMLNKWVLDTVS